MIEDELILHGIPRELAVSFFLEFARLEFAMKAERLLKRTEAGAAAEANWRRLARRLGPAFFDRARQTAAVAAIIDRPPKKLLVLPDGSVGFSAPPPPAANTTDLLNYLWRVRNNLFHGNKMIGVQSERNSEMLSAGRALITVILEADQALQQAFDNVPPFDPN